MIRRFGLSLLIILLALAATARPQQGGGVSSKDRQEARKPASVDSRRAERQPAPDSSAAEGGDEPRGVYTDDDVLSRRELPAAHLSEVEALEVQCFNEVNRVRVGYGRAPLELNESLLRVAREYSRRMAEGNFFSHDDPNGDTVRERVSGANIRWRVLGENLSYSKGYINPVAVSMTGWMASPGHRANLLDRTWRQTAIGVWISDSGTVYFTEIFMTQ
ncbi:MAG TPA: CAP domain-containing protein [Blastocatellia bacterium]|nr:CAP domain-containing protein [Blastocatellia bacterium]